MAKRPITPEGRELMEFLGFFFDKYMTDGKPIPPEVHPLKFVRKMAERAPKRALLDLKMAVADCIEASVHWQSEQASQADAALRDAGAVTLSEMRRRYWKRVSAILKRGRILNDPEYYFARGVASDGTARPSNQSCWTDCCTIMMR
jgi:hypothetical protein